MDISYLLFLQSFREATQGIFNGFFQLITDFGFSVFIFLVIAGVYWCADKKTGAFAMLSCSFGLLFNAILKTIATVYRPWIRDPRVQPVPSAFYTATGYSFPSGHTMGATSLYGALFVRAGKGPLRGFLAALILLIGFSRNYLGVHTPQDVLVGLAGGIAVVFLINKLLVWTETAKNADIAVLGIGAAACIFTVAFTFIKKFPVDYVDGKLLVSPLSMQKDALSSSGLVIGAVLGWFLEKRFLRFAVDGSPMQRLTRFLAGAAGLLLIYYPIVQLLTVFCGAYTASFFASFLLSFYIMYLFPLMAKKACFKK